MGGAAAPDERLSAASSPAASSSASRSRARSVNDPQLVLADEPTGNLDPDLSLEIMNLLREINAGGTTVLVATHDRELIGYVGRRTRHAGTGPRRRRWHEGARLRLRQGWASLRRGRGLQRCSPSLAIALALIVLGALLLVTWNAERVLARWSASRRVLGLSRDDATSEQRGAIETLHRSERRRRRPRVRLEGPRRWRASAREFAELAATDERARRQSVPGVVRSAAAGPDRRRRRAARRCCDGWPRCPAWPTSATTATGWRGSGRARRAARGWAWRWRCCWRRPRRSPWPPWCGWGCTRARDEIEIMELVGAPAGLHPRAVRGRGAAAGRHRGAGRAGGRVRWLQNWHGRAGGPGSHGLALDGLAPRFLPVLLMRARWWPAGCWLAALGGLIASRRAGS